ncbi:sodium:solute symporter family transporter, partial [Eubacterium aggregans]|uniref:sodium:solute symporter family transporter n=1 Tax=Eubacterium aggregans TaxID=81409 RepID=UPI003F31F16D
VSIQSGVFTSFFGPDPLVLLDVIILTSLGTWGLPQIVGKFYSISDEHAITKGMVISTFFAIIVAGGSYFLGGFGRLYSGIIDVKVDGYDAIIPMMLESLPDILIGIVVILVLSASMSTLSSLVMTSSSTLILDLIKDNVIKNMSEKKQILCIRILIIVFILISVVIAIVQYKSSVAFIAQLMGISWGSLTGSFLAPFLYGLYWKRVTKTAVWFSFLFSTLLMIGNLFFGQFYPLWLKNTPLMLVPLQCCSPWPLCPSLV